MNTETQLVIENQPAPLPLVKPEPEQMPDGTDAKDNRTVNVNETLRPAYQKASTLQLTEDERKAITAPFPDEAVEVRPHDGLLYIPHIEISDRLCQVFGPGQWCTVRRREWIEAIPQTEQQIKREEPEGKRIYAEWVLLVRGCFVGESVGAMDYHPTNPKMNYSDALEGTRGECIRRIAAKELGCGSQVWRPSYCRDWKARNAPGQRSSSVGPTPRAKTPPAASQPAKKATPEAKEMLIAQLHRQCPASMRDDVAKYLTDWPGKDGKRLHWLLPTERLEDLPADKMAYVIEKWDEFVPRIELWIKENDNVPGAEMPPKAA